MSRKLRNIFIHCSATPWGDVLTFDSWHKQRGWSGVGYHFVILNGHPHADMSFWLFLDGVIQPGRPLDADPIFENNEIGAHVAGRNHDSIGICLVGKDVFTPSQFASLKTLLCDTLLPTFDLDIDDVLGHYEDPHTHKTCPNIPMNALRAYLHETITVEQLLLCIADEASVNHKHLADKADFDWCSAHKGNTDDQ